MGVDFNLRNPNNPELRARLLAGSISPHWIVQAHPRELFPGLWDEVYERVAYKAMRKVLSSDAASAPDGAFTCRGCRSKKTVFTQMQTRSADEPMTLFVHCLNCGKRWKQ